MTKPRTDLLRQLANHLLHGELGHENFDFAVYNENVCVGDGRDDINYYFTPMPGHCGTNGCAIGECPILWPNEWRFKPSPVLISEKRLSFTDIDAMCFFNIGRNEFDLLFVPYSITRATQKYNPYGMQALPHEATKEQVANNIIKFCDYYDQ